MKNSGMQYGKASVHRVIDIDPAAMPLSLIFPGMSFGTLNATAIAALDGTHINVANGTVDIAIQSHLVRFGGKTILIDACIGEHKQRPMRPHWHQRSNTPYLANLAACGCTPDDIDIVMCTHLHADHVGWNTKLVDGRWVPTFPNARYLMTQAEIDQREAEIAKNPAANHGSYQDSVLPVIEHGRATIIKNGDAIIEGATILPLPGHSPGQVGLEIASGDGPNLLFLGDAIHSPVQVYKPDWFSAFCTDGALAVETRKALLARALAEDLILIPAHLRAAHMRIREQNGALVPVYDV